MSQSQNQVKPTFPFSDISPKRVHLVGIGGIGVNALARWFLAQKAQKWAVEGCDLARSPITQPLAKAGVEAKIGHRKGHITSKTGLVVYSQACPRNHVELIEARRRDIPALSYPEAVGHLTRYFTTVAITGAHGKTTTTAMVSLILIEAGFDPGVIVGANLGEFGGTSFRHGRGPYFVLEAEDYKAAFLHYSPALLVATNIDNEHLDYYKNVANIKKTFLQFFARTEPDGTLILNKENEHLVSLKKPVAKIAKEQQLEVVWCSARGRGAVKVKRVLKVPGTHNLSNAMAALAVARALGIDDRITLRALGRYKGAWRRLEYRGIYKPATPKAQATGYKLQVYDDFAHHPTEIRATLAALRSMPQTSSSRLRASLVCVFQPHQGKRLKALFNDFVTSFEEVNTLVLLPVYKVAGRDRIFPRYTSRTLAAAIKKRHPRKSVFYLDNPKKLKQFLDKTLPPSLRAKRATPTAVLVMMGAGDIVQYTDSLLGEK